MFRGVGEGLALDQRIDFHYDVILYGNAFRIPGP